MNTPATRLILATGISFLIGHSLPAQDGAAKRYGPRNMSRDAVETLLKGIAWKGDDKSESIGDSKAKTGGKIRYGQQSYPPTLRYFGKNGNTVTSYRIHLMVYETLLGLHPTTLEYVPGLASQWAIAPDEKTFYFKIDPRAKFSDGKPVTSYDVVASFDLLVDEGIEDPFWNEVWRKYERPEALTPDVVRVVSKEREWRRFMTFSNNLFIFPHDVIGGITGSQYIKDFNTKMLPGTGPYAYDSSVTNELIRIKRRPDYWAKDDKLNRGMNNFDEIEFVFVTDESLLFEKFKKGEVDFFHVLIAKQWHTETDFDKVKKGWIQKRKVYNHEPRGLSGIGFNTRVPPFDDIKVRQAFAHLFNREKLMDKIFFNEYEYTDSFFPGGIYENKGNPKVRYDPEKSVALLEEAGWKQDARNSEGWLTKDGQIFELDLNYTSKSFERILTILQEDLKAVGIKLNIKEVTWAEDIKQVGERNFKITFRSYASILFPNPEQYESKFADKKDNNNIWGLKDQKIDELSRKERLTFDIKERIKIIQEVDGILSGLHLFAFGWHAPHQRILYWNKFGMPDYILARYEDEYSVFRYWWWDEGKKQALDEAMKGNKELPVGTTNVRWWEEFARKQGETK